MRIASNAQSTRLTLQRFVMWSFFGLNADCGWLTSNPEITADDDQDCVFGPSRYFRPFCKMISIMSRHTTGACYQGDARIHSVTRLVCAKAVNDRSCFDRPPLVDLAGFRPWTSKDGRRHSGRSWPEIQSCDC